MAVRQYVGARYVPQIMGDWNDQTVYEPLSIVHYNFASYTSKKAVPAGVKPTNDEYWALSSQDSVQVEEYRQEVVAVQNQLDDMNSDIQNNTDIISDIPKTYFITNPTKRKYVFIIDSFGEVSLPSFATIAMQSMHIPSSNYYVFAKGGAGFIGSAQGQTFLDVWNNNKSTIIEGDQITDVYIIGGNNDLGEGVNSLSSAIGAIKTSILSLCPNAKITVGFNAWRFPKAANLAQSYNNYELACSQQSITFMPYMGVAIHDSTLLIDGVHPTKLGQNYLAQFLMQWIMGGHYQMAYGPQNMQITPSDGFTISGYFKYWIHDHLLIKSTIDISGPLRNNFISIGEYTGCIAQNNGQNITMQQAALLFHSGGVAMGVITFDFEDGKIYVQCSGLNNQYQSITNFTRAQSINNTFILPLLGT